MSVWVIKWTRINCIQFRMLLHYYLNYEYETHSLWNNSNLKISPFLKYFNDILKNILILVLFILVYFMKSSPEYHTDFIPDSDYQYLISDHNSSWVLKLF